MSNIYKELLMQQFTLLLQKDLLNQFINFFKMFIILIINLYNIPENERLVMHVHLQQREDSSIKSPSQRSTYQKYSSSHFHIRYLLLFSQQVKSIHQQKKHSAQSSYYSISKYFDYSKIPQFIFVQLFVSKSKYLKLNLSAFERQEINQDMNYVDCVIKYLVINLQMLLKIKILKCKTFLLKIQVKNQLKCIKVQIMFSKQSYTLKHIQTIRKFYQINT
ncbi:transmembrane protein, putative (macronuclear) [Tetrahymena thermophila SB210]|uniref:Transmembrane protein, putative n=1 Tax=Tetrahymena thermophila (strain SB210) TaxID=312017 RepID=W7XAI0_TETTS|nr:transmembrane protein, putative [Tetrahymena thermophila SB210]EWS74342.1 transmembrane protein, putative [Tetrahymena thermophila SB210]|eukprot:XP_012653163.1 transmembrane protein, putative [Tetrahymena thermophila SB210]